jgi:hypothetical protein
MELEIKEKKQSNITIVDDTKNPILEEYKKKYKPEELTADGIPTIETQLKELEIEDLKLKLKDEETDINQYNLNMKMRVKCLSLHIMGKSPLFNTYNLNKRERNKLQEIMYSYNDIDHKQIITEFNELMGDLLDDTKTTDYSQLPVYNA